MPPRKIRFYPLAPPFSYLVAYTIGQYSLEARGLGLLLYLPGSLSERLLGPPCAWHKHSLALVGTQGQNIFLGAVFHAVLQLFNTPFWIHIATILPLSFTRWYLAYSGGITEVSPYGSVPRS